MTVSNSWSAPSAVRNPRSVNSTIGDVSSATFGRENLEVADARVEDVHEIASGMPHVKKVEGSKENPVYQVGQKSFVFFRNARPDAFDPATGERYDDVIVIWVASEDDKQALVLDPDSPFFTTPHFNGHPSVLLRASRVGEIDLDGVVGHGNDVSH